MLAVREVAFNSDGTVDFYLDDAGVFWGHSITVGVDASCNISGADLLG